MDQWFTGNPNRTYFDTVQTQKEDKARQSFEIPFQFQGTTFGTTGICDVPVFGDYVTGLTLRVILPPIYTINPGQFVYPTTSNAKVYVNIPLSQVLASQGTLTANTVGTHGFSVGSNVLISGLTTQFAQALNGYYIILTVPTSNSFTCNANLKTGSATGGTATTVAVIPTNITNYFSTTNSDLWLQNVVSQLTVSVPFVFSSSVYSSITFASSSDAAFWGFDGRQGLTYSFVNGRIKPPWSFQQSGWIPGFFPASLSTYVDSVANKLIKSARILVGKQVINEFDGEYIEFFNDLTVPYENKAILKLLNGTLDQTQSTFSREYYVSLPLGTKNIPIGALTHQSLSVEIDFEKYQNLSLNLNAGSGLFNDPKSYKVIPATLNIQISLSYQQYLILIGFDGTLFVYDTSSDTYITIPASQTLLGTSIFGDCFRFNVLYIQGNDGLISSLPISDLIAGITTNFITNTPLDLVGPGTGSMTADSTHLYYAQSNVITSNLIITQYDTTKDFQTSTSYKSIDFTNTVTGTVTSFNKMMYTGSELIIIPNTTTNLYASTDFVTIYPIPYQTYGASITSGVVVGSTVYFVIDSVNLLAYNSRTRTFGTKTTVIPSGLGTLGNLQTTGQFIYGSSKTNANTSVFQINTDTLSTVYYSNVGSLPVPLTGLKIFAYGPRYVYMFTNDSTSASPIIRFDPYTLSPLGFQGSIIADYETGQTKPGNTLVGFVQTRKIQSPAQMDLRGPVKELWVYGNVTSTYTYSNLSDSSTLGLTNGENIVTGDIGTRKLLSVINPFETHTAMPVRNFSVIPFEIEPESEVPNGTINFSRIRDQVFTGGASSAWSRNYNILAIINGFGGLMFN